MPKRTSQRQPVLHRRLQSQPLEQRKLLAADMLSLETVANDASELACEFAMDQSGHENELIDVMEWIDAGSDMVDSMILESAMTIDAMMDGAVMDGAVMEETAPTPTNTGMTLINNGTIYIGTGFDLDSLQALLTDATLINHGNIVFGDLPGDVPSDQQIDSGTIESGNNTDALVPNGLETGEISLITQEQIDNASDSIDVSVNVQVDVDIDLSTASDNTASDNTEPEATASDDTATDDSATTDLESEETTVEPVLPDETVTTESASEDTLIVIGGEIEISEIEEFTLADLGLEQDANVEAIKDALNQYFAIDTLNEQPANGESDLADSGMNPNESAEEGAAVDSTDSDSTDSGLTDSDRFDAEVLALVNEARALEGLPPLTLSEALDTAADQYSDTMAEEDFFGHTGLDGTDAGDRIMEAGYQPTTWGENLAAGQQTPQEVVQGWLNSPGHRANILNASFTQMGLGYTAIPDDLGDTRYGTYWTQTFGAGTESVQDNTHDTTTDDSETVSDQTAIEPINEITSDGTASEDTTIASVMTDAMSSAFMVGSVEDDPIVVDHGWLNPNANEFLDRLFVLMNESLQSDSLPVTIEFDIALRRGSLDSVDANESTNDDWFAFLGRVVTPGQDEDTDLLSGNLLLDQLA